MPSSGSKWGWNGCRKYRFWRRGDYMVTERWEMGWGRQGCRYASALPILRLLAFKSIAKLTPLHIDGNQAGEIWAIALSADGQYLASTSIDGRINVWDNLANRTKIREFETKKNFGMSIDLVGAQSTNHYHAYARPVAEWEIHRIRAWERRYIHLQ